MTKILILAQHTIKELLRKKDFYILIILFLGLAGFFYGESFFGIKDISRYLKDIGLSLVGLFSMIITITFSAKQIPAEIETKTIYPLLAKPVSRTQFVLGKFIGSLFISFISFTSFYILYLGFIFSKGEAASLILLSQYYLLSLLLLSMLSAFALMFSLFLTISANISITFLLYFFMFWYNDALRKTLLLAEGKITLVYNLLYYILPHFEFFDIRTRIIHLWEPLPFWVVTAISIYSILYIGLLLWLTVLCFKRKNL
ncbi:MAG: ABC transporter permease [Candidatus Omnitrophica bacterium]|nr:ABC transporter permease [Candidatus Omnitrophota bacterium]